MTAAVVATAEDESIVVLFFKAVGNLFGTHPILSSLALVVLSGVIALLVFLVLRLFLLGNRQEVEIEQDESEKRVALNALVSRDPSFSEEQFLERAATAFQQVQKSWCEQNMIPVRHFLADGIYERFNMTIAEYRTSNMREDLENLEIEECSISQIETDELFDVVTVGIKASAVHRHLTLDTGEVIAESKNPESFVEYWAFIRRPDVRSNNALGLLEGICPKCAASLNCIDNARCNECQAIVRSGEYDWVLADSTRACEWKPRKMNAIPGVLQLRSGDPQFCIQHLEDKARVLFWRSIDSLQQGVADPLLPMASNEFLQAFSENFTPAEDGSRFFPGNSEVSSVKTVGIIHGIDIDQALVKVTWTSADFRIHAEGEVERLRDEYIKTTVFVLVRRPEAYSHLERVLSSSHCPVCGTLTSPSPSPYCSGCNTLLNDGNIDWILDHMAPEDDAWIQELEREINEQKTDQNYTPLRSGLELAAWMVKAMTADGVIAEQEEAILYDFARGKGISTHQIQSMILAANENSLHTPEPATFEEAVEWLSEMIRICLADGSITEPEKNAMLTLGRHIEYSAYDLDQLIQRVQKEHRQSTGNIKNYDS